MIRSILMACAFALIVGCEKKAAVPPPVLEVLKNKGDWKLHQGRIAEKAVIDGIDQFFATKDNSRIINAFNCDKYVFVKYSDSSRQYIICWYREYNNKYSHYWILANSTGVIGSAGGGEGTVDQTRTESAP